MAMAVAMAVVARAMAVARAVAAAGGVSTFGQCVKCTRVSTGISPPRGVSAR